MANGRTTADLIQAALHNAGELTDGSSPYHSKALEYINKFHQAFLAGSNAFGLDLGDQWSWAKADYPAVITLKAPHETGTVSLTNGSTSGTFSDAPSTSMAGRLLKIDDRPEFFRIASHTATQTAFTLDAEYTDDTGSGLSYKAILLDYSINPASTKIVRLVTPMRVYRTQTDPNDEGLIEMTDLATLNRNYPLGRMMGGIPTHFAQAKKSDGTIRVRFNDYVSEMTRVEFDYIPEATDLTDSSGSIPLIPYEHRDVLEYAATYRLMLDKEDSRFQAYLDLTQTTLEAMKRANRKELSQSSTRRGELIARQEEVVHRNPYLSSR